MKARRFLLFSGLAADGRLMRPIKVAEIEVDTTDHRDYLNTCLLAKTNTFSSANSPERSRGSERSPRIKPPERYNGIYF
jgi:hypothetical protein